MGSRIKKLAFTLDLKIYPFDLRFSFNETDEELKKFLKNKIEKEEHEHIGYEVDRSPARCVMFDCGASLIRMRNIPKDAEDYGILQHEICHYVMFLLFNRLHTPHNMDTTEAYAYLTNYITTEVYKRLGK